MNELELIRKRNKFLAWFLIACIPSVVGLDVIGGESFNIVSSLFLVISLLSFSVAALILTKKNRYVKETMYLMILGLTITVSGMISLSPDITAFLAIFSNLACANLYQNKKALILQAISSISLMIYFYIVNPEFFIATGGGISDAIFLVVAIVVLLYLQVLNTQKLFVNLSSKEQSEKIKTHMETVFATLVDIAKKLSNVSTSTKQNIQLIGTTSNELNTTFSELAKGIETQADSINNMGKSTGDVSSKVESLAKTTSEMSSISNSTVEVVKSGNTNTVKLNSSMEEVYTIINLTVNLMEDLNKQTQHIGSVLTTIREIAEQTNLLSLNASIEAARAGEHGKGFTVVADEIRQLANNSSESTKEIAEVLQKIQDRSREVFEKVTVGQKTIHTSKKVVDTVNDSFVEIIGNTEKVVSQAGNTDLMAGSLLEIYLEMNDKVQMISQITEESTASVQEVVASVSEQVQKINDVVGSIENLDALAKELKSITEETDFKSRNHSI